MQHQPLAAKMFRRAAILPQIAVFAVADNRMAKMGKMATSWCLRPVFGSSSTRL
jgi:hypothetical protein